MEEALFSCRDVGRLYEGRPVIEGISLELSPGGFVSLVGPSGVGKTTLFNILAGVDRPDTGQVFLAGEEITGCSGRVSYMLQKDLLLDYRTILDNVILPLLIRGKKKKEARQYAASFFPRFGLEGWEKHYPFQLSGGMRQRAALLRTCMTDNRVILLDEPFSALDAITRIRMREWYQEIAGPMGLSTLFITHDVEEAAALSDRVYVMTQKPGRINAVIPIPAPHPRPRDFSVSAECTGYKRTILEAVGL